MPVHVSPVLALVFALTAQSALADVTPAEVWQSWQDNAATQGQKITAASTAMDGDTLIVTGITVESTGQDATGSVLIGEMKFRDLGDGTVAIILPDSFPVLFTMPPTPGVEGDKPGELKLTVTMPGAQIIASGVPQSVSYATKAPSVEIAGDIGDDAGTDKAKLSVKLTDVVGNYLIEAAESGTNLTEDFSAKSLDLSLTSLDAAQQDVTMTLSLADLGGKVELAGIPSAGMGDFAAALKQGATLDAKAAYGIGSFDMTGKDGDQDVKVTGALGGGTVDMSFAATNFTYTASGKSISFNLAVSDGATGDPTTISATLANTASKLEMSGATWAEIEDFPAAVKGGLKMAGGFGLGPSSFDLVSGAEGAQTTANAQLGGLETFFAMDAGQMHYGLGAKAVKTTIASPELPVPQAGVDVTELALDFAMPLAKSDQAAPFNLLAKVVDLTVADALWSMFDPGGMLPRDPAVLIIDTKGSATLTEDLMPNAENPTPGTGAAPQLNALDITQILLKFAGAEVTASGALTFDNTDMLTFPGMPLPTGAIDIKALGLNGLIDTLVTMGLVPQDQAMQGRMMLSMFANTTPDRDEITSALEFKDGHFFANGQQLQ